jgi:hypothetical protein
MMFLSNIKGIDMSQSQPQCSHLQVFPVQGVERCIPGNHDGWAINMIDTSQDATFAGIVHEDRVPAQVLKEIFDGYPEMNGRIQVQWQSGQGQIEETPVGEPMSIMDDLMVVVSDETPEDAENTDEHPLEEIRSILIELDELMNATPGPE